MALLRSSPGMEHRRATSLTSGQRCGVREDLRSEILKAARETLQAIEQPSAAKTRYRTLSVQTPFFSRRENRLKVYHLEEKPAVLGNGGTLDQRTWRRYQSFLSKTEPVPRADVYRRMMERKGVGSIRALARVTGEDWSRIARILKVLELPEPVLQYLRTHHSPTLSSTFTERQLRELLKLKDPRQIWSRFQAMLKEIGECWTSVAETE